MGMNVFVTEKKKSQLVRALKSLDESYYCGNQFKLQTVNSSIGEYKFIETLNSRDYYRGMVRIIGEKILASKATSYVESALREKRIPFKEYRWVKVDPDQKKPKISLPKNPDLTYTPQKH